MKIVFLTRGLYPPKKGGVEIFTNIVSKELANKSFEIHIITEYIKGTKRYEKHNKLYIYRIKFSKSSSYILNSLLHFFEAFKIIRKIKPDIIHAFQTNFNGFYGFFIAKFLDIKMIIHDHGIFYDLPRWYKYFFSKPTLKNADYLLAPSKGLANNMEKLIKRKVTVIPNAVDVRDYIGLKKKDARKKLNIPKNKKIILFVGRLSPVKSLDTLISATEIVKQDIENVELILVGKGEIEKKLQSQVLEKKLEDIVKFRGSIGHNLIPTYMTMCDVFVLPSRRESFGIVLLEAMAAGKPCVASNIGGIPEIIEDNINGILVTTGDKHELANGIKKILSNQKLADKFIKNNRKKINNYSWEKVVEKLENVYLELGRK